MITLTVADIVRRFGCTEAQARALYRRNAADLEKMADKAERAPGLRYRGFTAAQLRAQALRYAAIAKAKP